MRTSICRSAVLGNPYYYHTFKDVDSNRLLAQVAREAHAAVWEARVLASLLQLEQRWGAEARRLSACEKMANKEPSAFALIVVVCSLACGDIVDKAPLAPSS